MAVQTQFTRMARNLFYAEPVRLTNADNVKLVHVPPTQNAVSLVTGGASGLGRATVKRFIDQGSRVVVCDLPNSKGGDLQKELGDKCIFVPTDVTVEKDVQEALNVTKSTFGRLDNVVNCAGIAISAQIHNLKWKTPHSLDEFSNLLMVNVSGTFNVIRLAVELINENEGDATSQKGVIINTSGISAYDGQQSQCAFSAGAGAVASMTLPLSRELSPQGIRVVSIAPGMFLTPKLTGLAEGVQAILASHVPFPRRLGEPEEYAHLCQSIIENPMLNGEVIRLDGSVRLMP